MRAGVHRVATSATSSMSVKDGGLDIVRLLPRCTSKDHTLRASLQPGSMIRAHPIAARPRSISRQGSSRNRRSPPCRVSSIVNADGPDGGFTVRLRSGRTGRNACDGSCGLQRQSQVSWLQRNSAGDLGFRIVCPLRAAAAAMPHEQRQFRRPQHKRLHDLPALSELRGIALSWASMRRKMKQVFIRPASSKTGTDGIDWPAPPPAFDQGGKVPDQPIKIGGPLSASDQS